MIERSSAERTIRRIAARATPLWDRRIGTHGQAPVPDAVQARGRLEQWRRILGSATILNTRLRSCGLSPPALDELLSGAQREAPLPSWASTLSAVLRLDPPNDDVPDSSAVADQSFDAARPLPFQDVLVGFIRHAREKVRVAAGSAFDVFCTPAVVELERQLLAHITFIASLTIGRDFYEFRFAHAPASAIETVWRRQASSTHIYEAYVRHMRNGGLVELLDAHPVLARLLSQSVEQWTSTSANLCRRFLDDFTNARACFHWTVERAQGALAHVRPDLSDRHHGGQTVIECSLRTNERVIYKPRTVLPELAFYRFVDWLNGQRLSLDLKVVRALDRATHGWVEPIAFAACRSEVDVERFYARAGMLLAVLNVLATTDVHCENLIASGDHPVVLDLETLLSENVPALGRALGLVTDDARVDDQPSVLSTGFLPQWQTAPDERRFDMSALGADETQDPGIRVIAWTAINTDQMTCSEEPSAPISTTHRAQLAGAVPSVADHLQTFLKGFKEMYSCLLVNRQALLANEDLLNGFDRLKLRVLLRDSETYARLHLHLLHPEFLKDGIDRSIELEWLARPLSGTTRPPPGRIRLYEAERTAMESLDIPHFDTSAWREMDHTAEDPDLWLLGVERDSRVLRRRLASLSPADCSRQLAAIEDAVRSRFGGH